MSGSPYPNQPPVPPNKGSSPFLIVLAVVGGICLLACAGACTGLFFIGRAANRVVMNEAKGMLDEINQRRTELEMPLIPAMARATATAEKFPVVVERIGSPLEPGQYHRIARDGSLDPEGEIVKSDITGPKGNGVLELLAVRDDQGQWQPTKVKVTLADGTAINIPDPPRIRPGEFQQKP